MPVTDGSWWEQTCETAAHSPLWAAISLGVFCSLVAAFVIWGLPWLHRRLRRAPTVDERLDQIERHLRQQGPLIDDLASRPEAMRPPPVEPGRDLNGHERQVVLQAAEVLCQTPDLISEGRLEEAHRRVAAQGRAVSALHERLSKEASAATKAAVAVLLASADIQLGTIAAQRHQYANAAEIYQRAVAWAQQGNDEETLRLALYQTGVAFAHGRMFRPAKEFLERARDHEDRPGRADTLNNLAGCLSALGDRPGALAMYEETLAVLRHLAESEPQAVPQYIATTLNNRGIVLRDMGLREDALAAIDEALDLDRQLADAHPEILRSDMAMTLLNRGSVLADMDRCEEALTAYDEALGIYRQLAEAEPDAFRSDVAMTLNNRGTVLVDMGRRGESLAANSDALDIFRTLAQRDPEAFRPDVAMTLNNRGIVLRAMDRREDALAAYDEAVDIRRQLAEVEPGAYRQYVAMTLNNRGTVLGEMGRREEALAAYDGALAIYIELADQEPQAFGECVTLVRQNRLLVAGGEEI